jgi:signal transduction histidine kinase
LALSRARIGGIAVNETARSVPQSRAWAKALHVVIFVAMSGIVVAQAAGHPHRFADPALLAWAAAIALVDLLPVPVWGSATVGMDLPLSVATAILYPAPVAGAVAMIGAFDPRELKGQIPFSRALFNRAQIGLSTMVVGIVFHQWATAHSSAPLLTGAALPALAAGYATNVSLVTAAMSLDFGVSPRAVLQRLRVGGMAEFIGTYLGLGLLGAWLVLFYLRVGAWSIAIVIVPVLFARQMLYRSRALAETTERLRQREGDLARQAQRLETLLEKEKQASAELRQLNVMRNQFVAVASHELRTPLTSILGFAKTLRRPEFSGDPKWRDEFLQSIERQSDRLLRMVENLFTLNVLEGGRVLPSLGRVPLEDLFHEVVEGLGSQGARVRLALEDDLPWPVTDRDLLARVLTNLLDNALKYSPADSECELGARGEDGSVVLWVRDRGIGIPSTELDRIFEPFYQVDSSSIRRFRGAGLGLGVVKGLVEHLGGSISVDSALGEGTTFTVRLPLEHPNDASSGSPPDPRVRLDDPDHSAAPSRER